MLDAALAMAHHILAFGLAAILAAQIAMVRPGLGASGLRRVGLLDAHYGLFAGAIIVIGVLRVIYGIKGPGAYLPNFFFWAKMAAFAAVGLLSIPPTLQIVKWRRLAKSDAAFVLPVAEALAIRRWFQAEAALFVLVAVFAALMARGYGLR
jgi:putative membrane protein